jgi:hypothetical protein
VAQTEAALAAASRLLPRARLTVASAANDGRLLTAAEAQQHWPGRAAPGATGCRDAPSRRAGMG